VPDDRILKSEAETGCLCMCLWASVLDMVEIERSFPVKGGTPICSEIRVWMCRRVWPTYNALQHWHVNWYTTFLYLNGKKLERRQEGRKTFSSNGYPKALIDSCIKTFLDRIYNTKDDKVRTCSKKIVYFCLPFTGHHGLHIRSQLSKVLASAYPHISIRVVFRPSCCLSSFFHLKTGFGLPWDHMLCISSRVNAVAHCMLAKHADTFTHVSQSIWESPLWLEKNALSQPCLVYSLTNTCTNTQSPLLISKSYHQALLSGIFLSVEAY
jgi:hypothetical protein